MEKTAYSTKQIGAIVVDDFRAASVFKKAGIDFCCGGKKTLDEACREKNIDIRKIEGELNSLLLSKGNTYNYNEWKPDFLSEYIINTHHKYVVRTLPELVFYTQKIAKVHGDHHPELIEVADLFSKINTELTQHLRNEEDVLFPAIKEALKTNSVEAKSTIKSEIERMNYEHEFAGGAMDQINILTSGYKIPEDACNTYRVCLQLLEQFEDDLHIHVHLENNILFPKALAL